ncbi:lysozyme C, milk isozyme-like [Protobothrops mucrosquamatus]|uniref:lysozyme C, milk isozyme-like n=1 Tax=Protobothrops mucrosquamatus TaxID=103944 RepID=UPI00077569EC|nr:lysozyme C, milk isozyme-like [Protobothrops mucrosquamatus]
MKALVLTLLFLFFACSEAKIYTKCELASVLKQNGMDGYFGYSLGNWICLAFHASKYNTHVVDGPNKDSGSNYGIFQINSRYWCKSKQGRTNNRCYKPCSAFLDDDITDDIACAKKIVRGHNRMSAWWPWKNNCKGTNVSKWSKGCTL